MTETKSDEVTTIQVKKTTLVKFKKKKIELQLKLGKELTFDEVILEFCK